jgi:putative transposase
VKNTDDAGTGLGFLEVDAETLTIKKRKLFPTDDSAKKVIYLAIQAAAKKWTMPIRNWKLALNRFMIEFEDRLAEYI